jgi:hypothetical protein
LGSPVSPVVAELFLQKLELEKIAHNSSIYFWIRYVDDVFCITRTRKKDKVLEEINNFHPSIQFTKEEESNGKIPFLDLEIYNKKDSTIGHCVFRKPTQTCKYLNYASFHPMAHKIGVVDTLFTRAIRLSDDDHLEEEIELTIEILKRNDYPEPLIKTRLERVTEKCKNPRIQNNEPQKRIILPFAGNVTSKIAHYLRKNLEIEIGYYPGPKLRTILCNTKQKIKKPKAGVYSFTCQAPCSAIYTGETERDFMVRFKEHIDDIRRENLYSPVALHCLENDHNIDQNSLRLIIPEHRKYFRKFKESLYIRNSGDDKINKSNGMNINSIWCSALLTFL